MRHFKFTLTDGIDLTTVDIMKDTLGNAIDTIQNIYGDHTLSTPLSLPVLPPCQPSPAGDS